MKPRFFRIILLATLLFSINNIEAKEPLHFRKARITDISDEGGEFDTRIAVTYTDHGEEKVVVGYGNGPIDAFKQALNDNHIPFDQNLVYYLQSDSQLPSYESVFELKDGYEFIGWVPNPIGYEVSDNNEFKQVLDTEYNKYKKIATPNYNLALQF